MQRNKKIATKHRAWNKGLVIGKRDGFTPPQVKRIRGLLDDRGAAGLRDLALFTTAIDTMLHGQDLLKITVKDVLSRNGSVRSVIEVAQSPEGSASAVRLVQGSDKGAGEVDWRVGQEARRLPVHRPRCWRSPDGYPTVEPPSKGLGH